MEAVTVAYVDGHLDVQVWRSHLLARRICQCAALICASSVVFLTATMFQHGTSYMLFWMSTMISVVLTGVCMVNIPPAVSTQSVASYRLDGPVPDIDALNRQIATVSAAGRTGYAIALAHDYARGAGPRA